MGRPKKIVRQPDLASTSRDESRPAPEQSIPPRLLQYTPPAATEKWRVELFDLLAAEFELRAEGSWERVMEMFHDFCQTQARTSTWFIVRRLYGVQPVVMPETAHPDDFITHTREQIAASLNLPKDQIETELALLKTGWRELLKQEQEVAAEQEKKAETVEKMGGELALADTVLKRFGFSESFFKTTVWDPAAEIKDAEQKVTGYGKEVPRSDEENKMERDWFVGKLNLPVWQQMLDEPLTAELARETLLNELALRRLQAEMMPLSQLSSKYKELQSIRTGITTNYRKQLEELQEKFPEMSVSGKVTFRQVISDLNLAHRQYYGHGDRRLWDRVHTPPEIQFLVRTSVQMPSPRYRLGWVVAVTEAIHGLMNPEFRSQLKKSELKKLDSGMKEGIARARDEAGEKQVNLETGVMPGEGDDFPEYGPDQKVQSSKSKVQS